MLGVRDAEGRGSKPSSVAALGVRDAEERPPSWLGGVPGCRTAKYSAGLNAPAGPPKLRRSSTFSPERPVKSNRYQINMKRTPKSKMASLHHFWTTARPQENAGIDASRRDEVITLSDSPLEHVNATPLSVSESPLPPSRSVPTWAPLVRRSTTSHPSTSSSRALPAPLRHLSPASETELEKAGYDPLEGSTIRYPANEHCRQYEVDIVKFCTAENSAICLPLGLSAHHICAVVIMNFLRWFPTMSCDFSVVVVSRAARVFEECCKAIGIPVEEALKKLVEIWLAVSRDAHVDRWFDLTSRAHQAFHLSVLVSIVDTFYTFKKTPSHLLGRLIVSTPQALEKIVESDSSLVGDIRCVVICLGALENSRSTRDKKIVGILTMKGVLFRVILVTPSVSSTSLKLGPLRKRQQIITSLIISQWIEPSVLDLLFRRSVVPLGISVEYYKITDGTSELRSFIEKWIEAVAVHFEKLHTLIPLPSTKPEQLFTFEWSTIISKARLRTDEVAQMATRCMLLSEATRSLVIHGPRVFYLYCVDLFRKANTDPNADNIALMILSDPVLSAVYEKIQAKYSYNSDCPFDISFNSQSFTSHPKFSRLRRVIDKCSFPVRCLILCENEYVSRTICEALGTPILHKAIRRVVSSLAPAAYRDRHLTSTECSQFLDRSVGSFLMLIKHIV
ncbi:hypothetical protein KIN20_008955 [Parelaphostrongylus tenuis]|uniref:Uncharacterized protein n=1 Tax=Parelaphostrongylus tenuis TaxID=148309 RepID=A0AAD5QKW4_PARTN|nr:hypothetical protein KIN20_008955 [Parelaphostrongylus tenuis]